MNPSLHDLRRAPESSPPSVRKRRLPAWLIPAGIALGFALLFLALFRDRILPATEVEVAVVLATPADAEKAHPSDQISALAADGPMAFQASGWVEPDPLPIKATALVAGVISEVHVLEGEAVDKDQPLANLIREDFELDLRHARQALRTKEAGFAAQAESIESARREVVAAEAEGEAVQALIEETGDRAGRIEGLSRGAIAEAEAVAIRSADRKARAAAVAAQAAVERAQAEVKRLEAQREVLAAEVEAAKVDVERAELALSRTEIRAPQAGRVLRLLAAPGQKKMLAMDDPDSATVAILFDPQHLQVRVDVPLADAAGLQIGQPARIRCSLLPDTVFHGEVTRITGEADLQRNTLQAKVRIDDPSDQLRPEMLCRVEFLETPRAGGAATPVSAGTLATWIPEAALAGETAWVCDPETKRVSARNVTPGGNTREGYVEIAEGLRPGEWVVVSPPELRDDQRVNPTQIQP
ncbi:efflux RND transporter periplasmic adaptor subunit [Haloferula sargassicola]|uniref:CusB-like beta-barrel domain-containing protein n=1 Tax=Haloferula sargassicola TaxID=490096 RepID=A0ABP9UR19_9BACT